MSRRYRPFCRNYADYPRTYQELERWFADEAKRQIRSCSIAHRTATAQTGQVRAGRLCPDLAKRGVPQLGGHDKCSPSTSPQTFFEKRVVTTIEVVQRRCDNSSYLSTSWCSWRPNDSGRKKEEVSGQIRDHGRHRLVTTTKGPRSVPGSLFCCAR